MKIKSFQLFSQNAPSENVFDYCLTNDLYYHQHQHIQNCHKEIWHMTQVKVKSLGFSDQKVCGKILQIA